MESSDFAATKVWSEAIRGPLARLSTLTQARRSRAATARLV